MVIFWFRRDLRLEDNVGLFHALQQNFEVIPIFIFDENILEKLTTKNDSRVSIIHYFLRNLNSKLIALGSTLHTYYGKPKDVFEKIISEFDIKGVYTNDDYEPYSKSRDLEVNEYLKSKNIYLKTYKDQCIFDKAEVMKEDGQPYTVFTPYMRKWKSIHSMHPSKSYPTETYFQHFKKRNPTEIIPLESLGFKPSPIGNLSVDENNFDIENYVTTRNFPSIENGSSRLSIHFRFGTISIRKFVALAELKSEAWLNELIWRDFYMMILWHFPQVVSSCFKPKYNHIKWRNDELEFDKWCEGKTGYPIVDAGMHELNTTGFMHNRLRMITASFLTKHLLIDWRWGESYFAIKLNDFDLSANNGGWQWAAGCGCDAAPYFRIFNPTLQTLKFDSKFEYIKKWIPDFVQNNYLLPIVEHSFARNRCLQIYRQALD